MKGTPVDLLLKLILLLVFGPALLALALDVFLSLVIAVLPWLIGLAILAGIVAGLTAGLVIRRRLPPRNNAEVLPPATPPLAQYRQRRPRGGGEWHR